jgi:glycosyltransferase involved in cell wall biosynthesis
MIDNYTPQGLRILHILSPVKWDGDTFNAHADSNWKFTERTIKMLPNCHHYILVPYKHTISIQQDNVSFVKYDYPKSVQLNRGMFDYRQITFDFTKLDIDFVFNNQPELTYNIQQWFHTSRYYEDVSYFNFYHWIDCNKSRGSVSGCPSFYMRQLESMHISDANFVHSELSIKYLDSNFKGIDVSELISKTYHMPVTSRIEVEPTPFDLPNKRILLFNHRWAESSGIKKLIEYVDKLDDNYIVWVTDENCDIKNDRFMVKKLPYSDYVYLLKNCHASLCFIDGYSTWNLAVQDCLVSGIPSLFLEHPTIRKVVGENYSGGFKNFDEFLCLLEINKADDFDNCQVIYEHDFVYELQLKTAMFDNWHDTKNKPKDSDAWVECIKNGITDKKSICNKVNPKVRLNGTAHFIRRNLLNNGISDNINKSHTEYFIEGNINTIKNDLFSNI